MASFIIQDPLRTTYLQKSSTIGISAL